MSQKYILALDQGTTSSRAILFDRQGRATAVAQQEFEQIYPQPGWVEHRPEDIWSSQLNAANVVLREADVKADQIEAIGITNQRETTIIWDRETGEPIHNAIVWQCRRTAADCDRMRGEGLAPIFQQRTGLVLDAYFSGTKVGWLLDTVTGRRRPRRPRQARVWNRRLVVDMEANRGPSSRHRSFERQPNPAVQYRARR